MGPLHTLLQLLIRLDGSDLLLTAGRSPALRIHGRLTPLEAVCPLDAPDLAPLCRPLDPTLLAQISHEMLDEQQRQRLHAGEEISTALELEDGNRFRCNVFLQRRTPALAIRAIPPQVPSCADLGLPTALVDLVSRRCGLILVAGPTGSGKSTTLAALLDHRARHHASHIVTLEDPIEYHLPHHRSVVNQREIGGDTQDLRQALHNALRQSPDVLMIGEIRTREALEHAIAFSDTGHLCLSTIHANRAAQSIERLINLYPEHQRRHLLLSLSLNLLGVVAQQLVPARDGGRVAAFELLLNTPRIADLIHQGEIALIQEAMERGGAHGMQTLDQSLYNLYLQGHITRETALEYAAAPRAMRLRLRLEGLSQAE